MTRAERHPMDEKTLVKNAQDLGSATKIQWRRDPGYFLVGTLLVFLFQAATIAASSPHIPVRPHFLIFSLWTAWLVIRIVRKRREHQFIENAMVTVEPLRPNLGGSMATTFTVTPKRGFVLLAWSVAASCTQTPVDPMRAEYEGEKICRLERVQYSDKVLSANETFCSSIMLTIPSDVPPTSLNGEFLVQWFLEIDVELAGSPVWRVKQPIQLTVWV